MLKQRLQQKLVQKLSPQQIQMIKLLEIPTMQLEQRIKKELEENPLLEEMQGDDAPVNSEEEEQTEDKDPDRDEFTLEDYLDMDESDIPSYRLSSQNYSPDDKHEDIPFSVGVTFHEFLQDQLGLRVMDERKQFLAQYIIGNIDEDGYLRRKLDAIADDIAFTQNFKTDEFELLEILRVIQDFDPAGVGARDLQECLLLQIERKDLEIPEIKLARQILKQHFDEFTRKHFEKIITRMDLEDEQFKGAMDEILHLNPKPGSSFSDPLNKETQQIVPDFILEFKDGDLQLGLNSKNVPELRLSRSYRELIENTSGSKTKSVQQKELVSFVKQKLDSARWFIDAIKQRQNTLMRTMEAIINFQREYFIEGDEGKLRPMILKDIAERTQLDISTISRVANSKYIQTHFGIFALKYFFSEGLQTDTGEEVSSREIKKILTETLETENKRQPITDEELADILQHKGYHIARRTVAKYREQLGIPVARLRKEMN